MMETNCNDNGSAGAKQLCRPRYFPRQVVTVADLTLDQEYLRERLRRHNRLLHGCGVICGLLAELSTDAGTGAQQLRVSAGSALDPLGKEIVLPEDVVLGVEELCFLANESGGRVRAQWPPPGQDPCLDGAVTHQVYYLACCYHQLASQPRPSISGGRCGGVPVCESSRQQDSYQLVLLDAITAADCVERHAVTDDAAWLGEYYQYPTQSAPPEFPSTSPTLVRYDPVIDFDWGTGSPDAALAPHHFMIRWTREVEVCTPGEYEFTARTDDGMRLWVDDELCVDEWHPQPLSTYRCRVALGPGRHRLRVEYYERTGDAVAQLSWLRVGPYHPPCPVPTGDGNVILAAMEARDHVFVSLDNFYFDREAGYSRKILMRTDALQDQVACHHAPPHHPTIAQIVPGSGQQGAEVAAIVFGQYLGEATVITFSGSGVTARVLPGGTDTWLPVEITIASDAEIGRRAFQITTPLCIVDSEDFEIQFEVRPVVTPPPTTPPPVTPPVVTHPPITPPVVTLLPITPPVVTLPPITPPVVTLPPIILFDPADFPGRLVDEVNGIGPVRRAILEDEGITNLAELASMAPVEAAAILNVSEVRAMAFVDQARRLLTG